MYYRIAAYLTVLFVYAQHAPAGRCEIKDEKRTSLCTHRYVTLPGAFVGSEVFLTSRDESEHAVARFRTDKAGVYITVLDSSGHQYQLGSLSLAKARQLLGKPKHMNGFYRFELEHEVTSGKVSLAKLDLSFNDGLCKKYRVTVPSDFPPPGIVCEWLPATVLAKPICSR